MNYDKHKDGFKPFTDPTEVVTIDFKRQKVIKLTMAEIAKLNTKVEESASVIQMIVDEVPRTLGELNIKLLMDDLKGVLKVLTN